MKTPGDSADAERSSKNGPEGADNGENKTAAPAIREGRVEDALSYWHASWQAWG